MAQQYMSDAHFRFFAAFSALRDFVKPPAHVIAEAALKPGDIVLDAGAGRGSFAAAAARTVGPTGKVIAVDEHPLAIAAIRKRAARAGLANLDVLEGSVPAVLAGVPAASINAVLLFDVFHHMADPDAVAAALARVLKAGGVVYIANPDKHVADDELAARLTRAGFFAPAGRTGHLHRFERMP
jgi:ubiquinone/menaquinone biosynthesis C-methylase UbiE